MVVNHAEILQALNAKLASVPNIPDYIVYENTGLKIPVDKEGVKSFFLPGGQTIETIGLNPETKDDGIYQVNVEVPLLSGTGGALEIAADIYMHFSPGTILKKNNTSLTIRKVEISKGKENKEIRKYVVPVSIYFFSYTI